MTVFYLIFFKRTRTHKLETPIYWLEAGVGDVFFNILQRKTKALTQKHSPIGLEAGVGDFAFPFATDPFAIDLPSRDEGLFQF